MIGRGNPPWRNSCRESGDSRELSYFDVRSGRRRKERKDASEIDEERERERKRLFFEGVESAAAENREGEANKGRAPNAFPTNLRKLSLADGITRLVHEHLVTVDLFNNPRFS